VGFRLYGATIFQDQAGQEELFLDCLILEDGIDGLSLNSSEKLQTYAKQRPTTARNQNILFTPKHAGQLQRPFAPSLQFNL
jgi:hypothetical protein